MRLCLASLLLLSSSLVACTGSDDSASPGDGGGQCTETSSTISLPLSQFTTTSGNTQTTQWTLLAPMSTTSVLAYSNDATGAPRVAVLDATGAHDVASIAGGANYYLRAARVGECAMLSAKNGLGLACPGQPYEAAGQDFDTSGSDPLFALEAGGEMIAFTQSYAAFTQITRSGPGQWTREEQFESSISYPTDALLANGSPVACFIDAGGHAVVTYGGSRVRSAAKAQWCKLALAGDTLTAVTDIGSVAQPLASFGADGVLALAGTLPAMSTPTRLVSLGGAPAALATKGGGGVVITALDGSASKTIPVLGGSTPALDVNGNALTVISTATDSTSGSMPQYTQTVLFETHCL
ncbi:MAG TPA: hypothetical protein VGM90_10565 [Kofleriaceae bacterium]|jgi:hypothetical protein